MKKAITLSILTLTMLAIIPIGYAGWLTTDGEGPVQTETRDVALFTQVLVEGSMDAVIVQDSNQSVEVKAQENILQLITTEVVNGVLIISSEKSFNTSQGVFIIIHVEDLSNLTVKGSGDILISDGFKADTMALKIMGSGDIKLIGGEFNELDCSVMGSGDIVVTGSADVVKLIVKGSGDINTRKVKADTVEAAVMGSGDIMLYAGKTLKASVKGSGDIMYSGDPEVEKSVLGSGEIYKK